MLQPHRSFVEVRAQFRHGALQKAGVAVPSRPPSVAAAALLAAVPLLIWPALWNGHAGSVLGGS
jgi:hypothetical protein